MAEISKLIFVIKEIYSYIPCTVNWQLKIDIDQLQYVLPD